MLKLNFNQIKYLLTSDRIETAYLLGNQDGCSWQVCRDIDAVSYDRRLIDIPGDIDRRLRGNNKGPFRLSHESKKLLLELTNMNYKTIKYLLLEDKNAS